MPPLRGILYGACMGPQTDLKLTVIHEAKHRDATMCISLIDFLMTLLAILLRSARNRHASQCLATTILGLQDEMLDPQTSPQEWMMFGGFASIRIQNAQISNMLKPTQTKAGRNDVQERNVAPWNLYMLTSYLLKQKSWARRQVTRLYAVQYALHWYIIYRIYMVPTWVCEVFH